MYWFCCCAFCVCGYAGVSNSRGCEWWFTALWQPRHQSRGGIFVFQIVFAVAPLFEILHFPALRHFRDVLRISLDPSSICAVAVHLIFVALELSAHTVWQFIQK